MTIRTFPAPADGDLSDAMQSAWIRDGYLLLTDFFDAPTAARLRNQARTLRQELQQEKCKGTFSSQGAGHFADPYFIDSGDKVRIFYEAHSKSVNKIGHALHDLDPVFQDFSYTPRLQRLLAALGLKVPGLLQSMLLFKEPEHGTAVDWHQDETYLFTDPPSTVGLWFAIDDADLDNGCLWAAPGHHHSPLRARFRRTGSAPNTTLTLHQLDATPWPDAAAVPLVAPSGSLVVLHGNLPHYSGPNRTQRPRLAYSLHVINRLAHYPQENWLQRAPTMPLRDFGGGRDR